MRICGCQSQKSVVLSQREIWPRAPVTMPDHRAQWRVISHFSTSQWTSGLDPVGRQKAEAQENVSFSFARLPVQGFRTDGLWSCASQNRSTWRLLTVLWPFCVNLHSVATTTKSPRQQSLTLVLCGVRWFPHNLLARFQGLLRRGVHPPVRPRYDAAALLPLSALGGLEQLHAGNHTQTHVHQCHSRRGVPDDRGQLWTRFGVEEGFVRKSEKKTIEGCDKLKCGITFG